MALVSEVTSEFISDPKTPKCMQFSIQSSVFGYFLFHLGGFTLQIVHYLVKLICNKKRPALIDVGFSLTTSFNVSRIK